MRRWSASAFRGENLRVAAVTIGFEMDALVQRIQIDRKAQEEGSYMLPWYHQDSGGFVDLVKFYRRLTMDMSVTPHATQSDNRLTLNCSVGVAVLGTNFNMIETGVDHEYAKVCFSLQNISTTAHGQRSTRGSG